jgi:KaiC/GvpD/RAD55 family RecA-like ATPase
METLLDRENRIPLAPNSLNRKAGGGAVPGDHIVIFGRPEAGKTLFTVNMAAGFLKMGHTVLYVGNEESTYKTRARIVCNLANCTTEQLEQDSAKAHRIARKRGLDLLRICHMEPGSIPEIEELLREIKPTVLILDQIRNVAHSEAKMTQRMEKVATELRAILAKHDVVGVSVTQAGDKTERHGQEPPPWLTMADVDSSRTGLPAQADLMIGIGADDEMRNHNTRAISLPKNKLGHSHEGFMVEIDILRSKVK